MCSVLILIVASLLPSGMSCKVVQVQSAYFGHDLIFTVLNEQQTSNTGRPSFYDEDKELFLYHDSVHAELGRWQIGPQIFGTEAIAYTESWCIHPSLMHACHDTWEMTWYVSDNQNGWTTESSFHITCLRVEENIFPETMFYLDTHTSISNKQEQSLTDVTLSGFYVEVEKSTPSLSAGPLYVLVGPGSAHHLVYMYQYINDEDKTSLWVIGQDMGTDIGIAFVKDQALNAKDISSSNWHILKEKMWSPMNAVVITGNQESNVYHRLRVHRSIQAIPSSQQYYVLRNSLPLPAIGFGTGGLRSPFESIQYALSVGYRHLDLAREYKNEHLVGSLLDERKMDMSFPRRDEIFLTIKVWPTELGFHPTTNAIYESLRDLRTNYIDAYLLHWPA